ncbi:MAG: hypothetical protein IAE78_16255 [Myxococcus sp.]|nr:hypothetical protein [Myxococcus sp.]
MLTFVLALSLTVDPSASPPPDEAAAEAEAPAPEVAKDQPEGFSRRRANAVMFAAGATLLGVGAALGAWIDRKGTFGRVCAVTAGALGLGLLAAGVGGLVTRLIHDATPPPKDPLEAGLRAVASAVAQGLVMLIAGVAGMVAGGLIAGFTTTPPGVQRGVVGVSAGALTAVMGATVLIAAW